MIYTLTLSRAEHGLLLHALLDQIIRRAKGEGGIEVYHDIITREDARPAELLARLQALDLSEGPCTGNAETCPISECEACSIRDCPHGEPLHYHHDGCPVCSVIGEEPA